MMQDHASPAKVTAVAFNQLCDSVAELENLSFVGTAKGYCGDHKRLNTLLAASKKFPDTKESRSSTASHFTGGKIGKKC